MSEPARTLTVVLDGWQECVYDATRSHARRNAMRSLAAAVTRRAKGRPVIYQDGDPQAVTLAPGHSVRVRVTENRAGNYIFLRSIFGIASRGSMEEAR